MLFRAEFFFDSKHLEKVHLFVASFKALNVNIQPVRNAMVGEGDELIEATAGGTMPELVGAQLRKDYQAGSKFGRPQMFEIARKLQFSPNSSLPMKLVEAGVIKKKGRGEYVLAPVKINGNGNGNGASK